MVSISSLFYTLDTPISAHLLVCQGYSPVLCVNEKLPCRLRTLSSQGGGSNAGPPSPTKPLQTPVTVPTANLVKKFKLAEFRYGKEELLQLFMESAELPTDMPPFPPISNVPSSSPLAFLPLSDEEQVRLQVVGVGVNLFGKHQTPSLCCILVGGHVWGCEQWDGV